jgi:cytochrome oxidase Cu insertion factor (SCO1/SenC/PrrC family)
MVCKAGNPFLLDAIHTIVQNVKNKFYGTCYLEPTGPKMLSTIIKKYNIIVDLKHKLINNDNNNKVIIHNNKIILKSYNDHINERIKYSKTQHYGELWKKRQIYKNNV